MGKISKVFYEEIDSKKLNIEKSGEYYFLYNLIGLNDSIDEEYMKYEEMQMKVRNDVIKTAIKNENITIHPLMSTLIMTLSSYKNKPVIIAEY